MTTLHPALLAASILTAAATLTVYGSTRQLTRSLRFALPLAASIIILNAAFNHRGATTLLRTRLPLSIPGTFQLTRESLTFGAATALLICATLLWFAVWQLFIPSDKFLYLFGRLAPRTALLTSMIIRWVPLTADRARQIRTAQKQLWVSTSTPAPVPHDQPTHRRKPHIIRAAARAIVRHLGALRTATHGAVRQAGVLMSWSAEDSILAADSMRARAYTPGQRRSSWRNYRFRTRDALFLAATLVAASAQLAVVVIWLRHLAWYPIIRGAELPLYALVPALLLFSLPLLLEGGEYFRWIRNSHNHSHSHSHSQPVQSTSKT
jgi:energy-coupling factor transport system permease protein